VVDGAEKTRDNIKDEVLADLSPEERAMLRNVLRRVLHGLFLAAPGPIKI
jgi:DNA-binding MarR family transcriptional regulator